MTAASTPHESFDLLIEPLDGDEYLARVVSSPGGEASERVRFVPSGEEIERLDSELGRRRRGLRRFESMEIEALRAFGGVLFDAFFAGDVGACLERSRAEVARRGLGLRLRLRLTEVPELAELPWEFLYDTRQDLFLSRSSELPLVRYQELPEPVRPLTVTPPVRVLAVAASPSNYSSIGVEEEWSELKRTLAPLENRGRLVLEKLAPATLPALVSRLRESEVHVFHFVGHGGFSEHHDDGFLVFEDAEGRGHPVDCQVLAEHIHEHPSLRLAVLNACEGARGSSRDAFSGVAQTLARRKIPAVVGMQFEIPDQAAVTFAGRFYEALVDGSPVDVATASARRAMYGAGFEIDWGAPVTYMRSRDGRLFELSETSPSSQPVEPSAGWIASLVDRGRLGTAAAYALAFGLQTVGWIGAAVLMIAGYIAFDPQRSLDNVSEQLLVSGALLAAPVGLYFGFRKMGKVLSRRQSPGLARLVSVMAAAVAVAAVWSQLAG